MSKSGSPSPSTSLARQSSPYICITSDTHAGAAIDTYGEYLDPAYRADFEAWRGSYRNPRRKHVGGERTKNWDSPAADAANITPELVAMPLDEIPADSQCLAFQRARLEQGRAAR